jgi:ferritin-like metal-binding protein YciE
MLKDLLVEELSDILSAETQLTKALPKMAKASTSPELVDAFEKHLEQTKGQVDRLNRAFESLGEKPEKKTCKGMAGLIQEGDELIKEGKEKEATELDLALIGAAQRVEHYEISAYGTVRTMAERLGEEDVASLLAETLEEEEQTDELLTSIADTLYEEMTDEEEEEEGEAIEDTDETEKV